jgi:hypothetical protein
VQLASRQTVEIVRVVPGEHELWAVACSGGDTDNNGKVDVTPNGTIRLPLLGDVTLPSRTVEVPVEQMLSALAKVAIPAASALVPSLGSTDALVLTEAAALFHAVYRRP